ncbi:hypothetical protein E2C01_081790 [Portunus trituberculatus]|uniref:Uncharacterized protein n=1 Tax=Portunus trituberculatus TaxID=210409 RepID=A0A5B7IZ22_PORTR|nr:hypothetical protein [Portunus trituberculatus]
MNRHKCSVLTNNTLGKDKQVNSDRGVAANFPSDLRSVSGATLSYFVSLTSPITFLAASPIPHVQTFPRVIV